MDNNDSVNKFMEKIMEHRKDVSEDPKVPFDPNAQYNKLFDTINGFLNAENIPPHVAYGVLSALTLDAHFKMQYAFNSIVTANAQKSAGKAN